MALVLAWLVCVLLIVSMLRVASAAERTIKRMQRKAPSRPLRSRRPRKVPKSGLIEK